MAKKRIHREPGTRPIEAAAPPARSAPRGPAGSATSAAPGEPGPRRRRFEAISAPWLLRMQRLPGFVVPVLLALLLFLGLTIRAEWAGTFLIVIAVFLTWLTAISWPVISARSRVVRVVVDVGVLALGVLKLLGRI
ncbi:MAG: DUF6703 family protein [Candidatus Nanopelagicales bacterium]